MAGITNNYDYDSLIRHADGHLRAPFSLLALHLRIQSVRPSIAERRAIENASQFLLSLSIFSHRIRGHLANYSQDSWVEVPFYELFLDVQSLFLFTQQFFEDLAKLVRLSLSPGQSKQMSTKFRKQVEKLCCILPNGDPFKVFLDDHEDWFKELSAVRDDICHRTAYDRVRAATFPEMFDVIRAGGGVGSFLSGADLRGYIGGLFQRVLALSCTAERFIYAGIRRQHPGHGDPPSSFVLAVDEYDELVSTNDHLRSIGTVIMTISRESMDDLEYFLKGSPKEPTNPKMEPTAQT